LTKASASTAEPGGRASIHDVARLAGVSTATVSRVLTGSRGVRQESADAVLAAVTRLGYRTNQLGRALRRQSTQAIAMIVPTIDNPFFPPLIQSTERYLRSKGYAMMLCTSDDDPDIEADRVNMLLDRHVDGLLVSPCHRKLSAPTLNNAAQVVPTVEMDRGTDGFTGDFVAMDDYHAISEVVKHLHAIGRTRLAYVGGDRTNWSGEHRQAAFAALEPDARRGKRMLLGQFSENWGYEAGQQLFRRPARRPDAVVCGNDLIALGVIAAAHEADLTVPGDVAVAGYDDIEIARRFTPSITTMRQPVHSLTETAAELLVNRLKDPNRPPTRSFLKTELIVRDSTGNADKSIPA